ncbi:hypothetical protein IWZ03DRAFT_86626 [Phyllosticta citriasiana]|uniref:Secreted peptide n=1 Tax=Phyllosticta citriasiana TaxID=595635 RepID=A0ABR1KA00_9PEZI
MVVGACGSWSLSSVFCTSREFASLLLLLLLLLLSFSFVAMALRRALGTVAPLIMMMTGHGNLPRPKKHIVVFSFAVCCLVEIYRVFQTCMACYVCVAVSSRLAN